jgi:hypothetical protein
MPKKTKRVGSKRWLKLWITFVFQVSDRKKTSAQDWKKMSALERTKTSYTLLIILRRIRRKEKYKGFLKLKIINGDKETSKTTNQNRFGKAIKGQFSDKIGINAGYLPRLTPRL